MRHGEHGYVLLVANTEGNDRRGERCHRDDARTSGARGILYSTWYHREIEVPELC